MTQSFSPKTVSWEPPTNLPENWKVIRYSEDGAAYKNRTGLCVMISCCVESDGKNWVHLSVSKKKAEPTWYELVQVKELFLGEDSLAIQVLPPRSEWVNDHSHCLHLYECLDDRPIPDFRKLGTI
jgi:hypothetical protein